MLLRDSLVYKKTFETQLTLKWVEVGFLCSLLILVFWHLYTSSCSVGACQDISISYPVFQTMLALILPVVAVVGSFRVATVFMLIDPDQEKERWFYISLAGISACYSVFGIFYNAFYQRITGSSGSASGDNWALLLMLAILIFTVGSLLREKQTWDKSNFFIRFRISFCLVNLILLILNPVIGLVLTFIFTPILVLISEGKIARPEFDLSGLSNQISNQEIFEQDKTILADTDETELKNQQQ